MSAVSHLSSRRHSIFIIVLGEISLSGIVVLQLGSYHSVPFSETITQVRGDRNYTCLYQKIRIVHEIDIEAQKLYINADRMIKNLVPTLQQHPHTSKKKIIITLLTIQIHTMLQYLKVSSENLLPPINLNSLTVIICIIVCFKALFTNLLRNRCDILPLPPQEQPTDNNQDNSFHHNNPEQAAQNEPQFSFSLGSNPQLEESYYFHLAFVMLIIPEVPRLIGTPINIIYPQIYICPFSKFSIFPKCIITLSAAQIQWNVFDISVWVFSYVIVGIVRNGLKEAQARKDSMLSALVIEHRVVRLLRNSQRLALVSMIFSLTYLVLANYYFFSARVRVNQILLYPTLLLTLDSVLMLIGSGRVRRKLAYFLNNNIDELNPVYQLEAAHAIAKSSLKVWHYSYFIRVFYKSSTSILDLFYNPWIITLLTEFYEASKKLATSVNAYNRFNNLLEKINVYLPKSNPVNNQICSICQEQLLSCRMVENCGHKFHFKCIFMWVQSKSTPQCPICRTEITKNTNRGVRPPQPAEEQTSHSQQDQEPQAQQAA